MPIIISNSINSWSRKSAIYILQQINKFIDKNGYCNLMLTGGATAEKIYIQWANIPEFPFNKINFYFGDERCVNPTDINSNFLLVKKSLFKNIDINFFKVYRIKTELADFEEIIKDYSKILPNKLDIILLGLGFDGHIASLFPKSINLTETNNDLVFVNDPNIHFNRISISPKVLLNSSNIYLLANGINKGKVLKKSLEKDANIFNYPVCLVKNATWLVDDDIVIELNKN